MMIGLDTNVLVRYFTQDDEKQSKKATKIIENELSKDSPGYMSSVVFVELCWVLRRIYKVEKVDLAAIIHELLNSEDLQIEHREEAWKAYHAFSGVGIDFSDSLLGNIHKSNGCNYTVTFDKGATKSDLFKLI